MRNEYKNIVRKHEGKRPHERLRSKRKTLEKILKK
jgi:hypothetical protein